MKGDHYKILEVSRDASAEDIQHAYRTLALRYHPDRNSSPDAAMRMTAINEAWEVLGDPRRRREYDGLLAKPAIAPEFAASIFLAARDVILRGGWCVLEDSGKMLLLEKAHQKLRIVFRDRVDAGGLVWIARQSSEFCVVLTMSIDGRIPNGVPVAVIDLLHSEHHGSPLPDGLNGPSRSLFAAFL